MSHVTEKLKEWFENTVESEIKYDGKFNNMEYFSLICKAGTQNILHTLMGTDVCMFNCTYEGEDAVMILFYITTSSKEIDVKDIGTKDIADRVIEIISGLEQAFVTLDYVMSEEVKEDKRVYVTAIKKIK